MVENKVIAIFSEYYPPHLGGLENYVYNIANKLNGRGYKIILVTTRYSEELMVEEKVENVNIIRYPVHKLFISRYPIPKRNSEYKALMRKLEDEKIDFVILNTRFFLSTYIGAEFSYKMNIPNLVIEHGCEHLTVNNKILDYFGSLYEHFLTKKVSKYINEYYGVSKACNDWLNHFNLNAAGVLNGAVNIDEKDRFPKKTDENKIVFTYAGRLLKQKGVLELVEAFISLCKKYDNIELYIAGKGELQETLESYAIKNKDINLMGYLNHDELMRQLSKTDVFVYTPIWPEGLGISVIEAGLLSCATIISNQKGIMEVVPDNTYGLIVDNNHPLKDCMEMYINDRSLRKKMATNLNERVINKFSWNNTVDEIEKIISKKID